MYSVLYGAEVIGTRVATSDLPDVEKRGILKKLSARAGKEALQVLKEYPAKRREQDISPVT